MRAALGWLLTLTLSAPAVGQPPQSTDDGPVASDRSDQARWWLTPAVEWGWSRPQAQPVMVVAGVPGRLRPVPLPTTLDVGSRIGFSLAAGTWFGDTRHYGIDASVYFLAQGSTDFTHVSPAGQPLWLPVVDGPTGTPAFFPLAGPDVGTGAFQAFAETKYESADVNLRRNLLRTERGTLDALFGYRYAHLGEGLHLYNKRMNADGHLIRTKDHFSTAHHFHGGQLGLHGEVRGSRWYGSATGKLALGGGAATRDAEGAFRVDGVVDPYGFFTRPALAGSRSRNAFAVLPTVNLMLGRQAGERGRVFVGYTVQWLSGVTRPSELFDPYPALDGSGIPGDSGSSVFWVQSVQVGAEWRY